MNLRRKLSAERPSRSLCGVALVVLGSVMGWSRRAELRKRAQAKKSQLFEQKQGCLAPILAELDAGQEELMALKGLTAEDLAMKIKKGEKTSEEAIRVFIARTRVLGRDEANCVMEEMYDKALAAAQDMDAQVKRQDPSVQSMLLSGVPISVKDHIDVTGTDSTCGTAVNCLKPKDKDALVVELLKDEGAVPFVKTNVPQALLTISTDNNIIGAARSPWDTTRNPGGSTGGEGGLLAARASLLGIGTDIGGSIRVPCHFCGIYGILTTPGRTSMKGITMPFLGGKYGQTIIRTSVGPMGLNVNDLTLVLRAWWVEKMWRADATIPRLPFNQSLYETGGAQGRKLRVGYFTTDNWFQPCRTVVRAVHEAKAALEKAGCEVVELPIPGDGWHLTRLYLPILVADGDFVFPSLQGEAHIYGKALIRLDVLLVIPNLLRCILSFVLELLGQKRAAASLRTARWGGISAKEYWELSANVEEFREAFMGTMDSMGLDAFICPVGAFPCAPQSLSQDAYAGFSYACLTNLLQWPGGAVPITTVRQQEAVYPLADLPPGQRDLLSLYLGSVMKGAEGLPVGVQVVARPYQDEVALHVMRLLEKQIQFKVMPPMAHKLVANMRGQGKQ